MNGPQVRGYAVAFADRLGADSPRDKAVEKAFQMALGRDPSAEEFQLALDFLGQQESLRGEAKDARRMALADLCQTIFAMNEFVFVE
jgi:hypothetical protein